MVVERPPRGATRRQLLVGSALASVSTSLSGAPQSRDLQRWRQYVTARTGQVHVFSARPARPTRRTLVCLHPSPTSGEMYAALQGELARDRVVHCPDTPGFGASDAPRTQPAIGDYAAALGDAIAALVRGPIDLFGFHTGSLIAAELAVQRPRLVHRLVLAGVPHYDDADRPRERSRHVAPYPYFRDSSYVATLYQRLVIEARDSGTAEERLRRFGDRLRAGSNGWWGPDAVFTYQSDDRLPLLTMPTLLIAFNEEMTDPTRRAARLVPKAELMEMLDLPIFGFIVDPGRVAAAVRQFVDGTPV